MGFMRMLNGMYEEDGGDWNGGCNEMIEAPIVGQPDMWLPEQWLDYHSHPWQETVHNDHVPLSTQIKVV